VNDLFEFGMGYATGLSIDDQYLLDIWATQGYLKYPLSYHAGDTSDDCFYSHDIIGVERQKIFDYD
jgi:hypothetical protein